MNNAVTAYLKDNRDRFLEALKCWLPWGLGPAAGGLPVNVKILLEREEEASGESIGTYVRSHAARSLRPRY
jgi:hypothetical protein